MYADIEPAEINKRTLELDDTYGVFTLYPAFFRLFKGVDHVYTSSPFERNNLKNAGWADEDWEGYLWGNSFGNTTSPVFRFYNGVEHMYTTSLAEKQNLMNAGWRYENVTGYAFLGPQSDTVPLYRLFKGVHLFTVDNTEKTNLKRAGWTDEGTAFYVRMR